MRHEPTTPRDVVVEFEEIKPVELSVFDVAKKVKDSALEVLNGEVKGIIIPKRKIKATVRISIS